MNKKNFKTSFDDLLGDAKSQNINQTNKNKSSLKEQKVNFIVKSDQFDKLKAISFLERTTMKNILNKALTSFFETYEKDHGKIILPN